MYIDGVVLSSMNALGNCNHVWTFAAVLDEVPRSDGIDACPCTYNKPVAPSRVPAFIGEVYFCKMGTVNRFQYGHFYVDDPLWDGDGCGPTSTCCS